MREEQAILWFFVGLGVLLLVGFPTFFLFVTHLLGAQQAVPALTLLALVFVLCMLFYFSLKLANLEAKFNQLVRQQALNQFQKATQSNALLSSSSRKKDRRPL
jgi:hypothetical protein